MDNALDTQSVTEYTISVKNFEGPVDLLYQLIDKRKMQINTVSLSKITEDFLAHVRLSAPSIKEVAYFLHIASILILIKSKSLLPLLNYTDEEDVDVASLQEKIKLYGYIQNKAVPALLNWRKVSFSTVMPKKIKQIEFLPDASCKPAELYKNASDVIASISFLKEPKQKVVSTTVRIEDVIEKVLSKISERMQVSFNEMTNVANKMEVVVSFLAVLELTRKNLLQFSQTEDFGDIVLYKEK